MVRISNYGKVVNQLRFIETMQKQGIRHEVLPMEQWVSPGGITQRNRDAKDLQRQYYKCSAGYMYKTLWENRLYPCARAASIARLCIDKNIPYVDALKRDKLRERLMAFYVAPTCECCDCCDMAIESVKYVEHAIQIER